MSSKASIAVKRQIYTEEAFAHSFHDHDSPASDRPFYKKLQHFVTRKLFGGTFSCREFLMKLFPILEWLPKYSLRQDMLVDFTGGVTVGVMHIPQGLAFAMLASLPPVTGLYTALVPVLIYMLMGTSKYLSQGSFAVICLMVAQVCEREVQNMNMPTSPSGLVSSGVYNASNGTATPPTGLWTPLDSKKLEVAISLSLLIGMMQVAMGVVKLGCVATYLSDPIISGFTTGSAVLVVLSQIKHILGQSVPHITGLFSSVKILVHMSKYIASSNLGSVITGIISLVFLIAMKQVNERFKSKLPFPIPAELLVVVIGTGVSYGGAINTNFGVKVLEHIPEGLPPISLPSFQLMNNLIPDAFVISIVIFATNISLSNMFAKKHGQRIDSNQELIAYGLCNIGGSFFSCFPICNALARTAVQENLAHSQLCSIPVVVLILLVLLFLAPLFFHLPKAILAAVVIANLIGLLKQFARLRQLWNIFKVDAVVWFSTCFGVILLGVDLGLGLGIIVAVLSVVLRSSRPRVSILGHVKGTELYRDIKECSQAVELPGIKVVRFESFLYFANADYFKDLLLSITSSKSNTQTYHVTKEVVLEVVMETTPSNKNYQEETIELDKMVNHCTKLPANNNTADIRALIVDASTFTLIDTVGIAALSTVITDFKSRGIHVCLAACSYHLQKQLMIGGSSSRFQGDHLFVSIHDAVSYILQARSPALQIAAKENGATEVAEDEQYFTCL